MISGVLFGFRHDKVTSGGTRGILAIVFFCMFTFASAVRYPGPFSPMDNWLSDLGTASMNPSGNMYFNARG